MLATLAMLGIKCRKNMGSCDEVASINIYVKTGICPTYGPARVQRFYHAKEAESMRASASSTFREYYRLSLRDRN